MSDRSKRVTGRRMYESTPSSRQVVKFMTAATIGSISLVSCGLTFTGSVLILILSTPILVLFSPILVPAVSVVALAAAGLLFSGSCAAGVATAVWWMYRYATGEKEFGKRVKGEAEETTINK